MEISVDGIRASASDWQAVRNLPAEDLPKLNDAQREVARKLKISEQDYARSALAGQRTTEALLTKTETLGRLLEQKLKQIDASAAVVRVALKTWDHRFDVELSKNSNRFNLRVDENLVDDLLEGGSANAAERLQEAIRNVLSVREH